MTVQELCVFSQQGKCRKCRICPEQILWQLDIAETVVLYENTDLHWLWGTVRIRGTGVPHCGSACSVMYDSLWLHRPKPARLLCAWDFPSKNTGLGCHFLFQGIFLTQGFWVSCLGRCIIYHCGTWKPLVYCFTYSYALESTNWHVDLFIYFYFLRF